LGYFSPLLPLPICSLFSPTPLASRPHTENLKKRKKDKTSYHPLDSIIYLFIYFAVLGFELRAYTLNHSTSSFL
jgi:hypothetical protein